MMDCEEKLERLKAWLTEEISKEEAHLRSIGGPTGMRNSQASAMGLARNAVRCEVLAEIEKEEQ